MSTEEIYTDNKLSFEAMELLIRLRDINAILKIDNYAVIEQLSSIKARIKSNLKALDI